VDQYFFVVNFTFAIGIAGVVDVARIVAASGPINRPILIHFEKIPRGQTVGHCGRDSLPYILQNKVTFFDKSARKKSVAFPSNGSFYDEPFVRIGALFLHTALLDTRVYHGHNTQMKKEKLSTEPYKGVRDFYPEDEFIQRYIFEHMERVCELFGYEEYAASVLEPAELYRSKTSQEIVNEQTYTFKDRADREVTLRPEMTPTLARMVAAKGRDLPLPTRWYTIANVFRYERPQRGRLREHWQLNADIIGAPGIEADAEILALAHTVMRAYGADERDFEIRVSDRRILDSIYEKVGVEPELHAEVTRLLDRRGKMENFKEELEKILGDVRSAGVTGELDSITSSAYLEQLRSTLENMGIGNMVVDTKITRGFDYYTGMVFEVFDTHADNRRSLFGGGRYDNLLTMFGSDPLPAVGFGMGDVTARDFLEAHGLLPRYAPSTELMICIVEQDATAHAIRLAQTLRAEDVTVAVNFSGKRVGDQIRQADKMKIPFVIAVGTKERESGQYTVKNLSTGKEATIPADKIAEHLFSSLG
jgi:histidyl-tRNA synthetase